MDWATVVVGAGTVLVVVVAAGVSDPTASVVTEGAAVVVVTTGAAVVVTGAGTVGVGAPLAHEASRLAAAAAARRLRVNGDDAADTRTAVRHPP